MSHSIGAHNSVRSMRDRRTASIEFICREWVSVRAVRLSSSMTAEVIDSLDDSLLIVAKTCFSSFSDKWFCCRIKLNIFRAYQKTNNFGCWKSEQVSEPLKFHEFRLHSEKLLFVSPRNFTNFQKINKDVFVAQTWCFNFSSIVGLPCMENIELHDIPLLLDSITDPISLGHALTFLFVRVLLFSRRIFLLLISIVS